MLTQHRDFPAAHGNFQSLDLFLGAPCNHIGKYTIETGNVSCVFGDVEEIWGNPLGREPEITEPVHLHFRLESSLSRLGWVFFFGEQQVSHNLQNIIVGFFSV